MNIEVNFGNRCNMNCSYCFVKNFETDKEIEKKHFLNIAKWLENIEIEHFRPVGGEPSLDIDKIEFFLDILNYKPKSMTIVTNGTLLNELSSFCKRMFVKYSMNITIACSIDKIGYDSKRKIDTSSIINNIIELKEKYSFINYSINRVVSDQTEEELKALEFLMEAYDISIYSIPLTNKTHEILSDFKENRIQTKLCGSFCKNGLYFYKDKIYLCKLCQNIYNKGLLGSILDPLETILNNRDKYTGCTYEKLNGGVKC